MKRLTAKLLPVLLYALFLIGSAVWLLTGHAITINGLAGAVLIMTAINLTFRILAGPIKED